MIKTYFNVLFNIQIYTVWSSFIKLWFLEPLILHTVLYHLIENSHECMANHLLNIELIHTEGTHVVITHSSHNHQLLLE